MSGTRIITLAPGSSVSRVATFEEAFGDFSEARGKGRERRAARKSDRREKKTTKKLEKVASKDSVKRAKREGRIARKSDRKTLKKTGRQERRTGQMQARQDRKMGRKDMRVQRKKLGQEPELEMDEQTMAETDNNYGDTYENSNESNDQGQYVSEEGDTQSQGYGNGEGEYQTTQESDYDESEDEGEYDEEGDYDESEDEGEYDESEQADYEDEDFENEYPEDEYGFDGIMGAEDRFSEAMDSQSASKKAVNVDVNVQAVANKIQWNKELVSRLRVQKAIAMGENKSTQAIETQINERLDRIKMLQTVLEKYTSFEGEFSSADGSFKNTERRKASATAMNARRREVGRANAIAMQNRAKVRASKRSANAVSAIQRNARKKGFGGDVTPIEAELNPSIANQRIEIPAASNATGTGLNGIDLQEDFDAPPVRTVELTSNADGSGSNIPWKGIAIGAVIGIAAIWAIKKYKVFGK
jgi:hypothetical protein